MENLLAFVEFVRGALLPFLWAHGFKLLVVFLVVMFGLVVAQRLGYIKTPAPPPEPLPHLKSPTGTKLDVEVLTLAFMVRLMVTSCNRTEFSSYVEFLKSVKHHYQQFGRESPGLYGACKEMQKLGYIKLTGELIFITEKFTDHFEDARVIYPEVKKK